MLEKLKSLHNGNIVEMLEVIIEHAPDGVITVDEHQLVVMFNRAAQKIFGYSYEEILGQRLDTLIPEKHREAHNEGMKRFAETHSKSSHCSIGSTRQIRVEGLRKSGEVFPCEITVSKIEYDEKQYFTAIVRDVSLRVQQEQRIKEQEEELQRYRSKTKAKLFDQVKELSETGMGEFKIEEKDND